MFYIAIFVVGLMAGAGPEKTQDVFNKAVSKGSEITQSAKNKASQIADSTKSKAIELKNKINK